MFEEDLMTFVKGQSPAPAGGRLYPLRLPQDPTLPAMTYGRLSAPRDRTLDGVTGRVRARIRFHIWADGFKAARTLAETMRQLFKDYSGTMGFTTVNAVSLEGEADQRDPDTGTYHTILDFMFTYKET